MKALMIICSLAASTAAFATPVEQMAAQGFACDPGTHGEVICRKEGEPTKVCNAEGSCFRIVYESGALSKDKISTGSIYGGIRRTQSGDLTEY